MVRKETELSGIPIDQSVLTRYHLYRDADFDSLVFDGNGQRIVYHPDDGFFSINGEPGGYVSYLHELSNIIEEICGYPLSRYYGHTSQQAVDNRLRPTSSKDTIRQLAYRVLCDNYPQKLTASEIAENITMRFGVKLSRSQVHRALRQFARGNIHFSIFPSFFPTRVRYSVYKYNPSFDEIHE